jgi:O-antigen ligase
LIENIKLLGLFLLVSFIGTGVYVNYAGYSYFIVAFIALAISLDRKFFSKTNFYIYRMIFGFIILNIFLLIQLAFSKIIFSYFLFNIISILVLILTYLSTITLIFNKNYERNKLIISFIIIIAISIILISQMAQILGYLELTSFQGAESRFLLTRARPGGFLNPNETAVIAIIFLYSVLKLNIYRDNLLIISIAVFECIFIVLLSQSRASMIFLVILLILSFKLNYKNLGLIIIISALFFLINNYFDNSLIDLFNNFVDRFKGDSSSAERLDILHGAIQSFLESPFFGNGSDYLINKYGVSSHNQFLEILSSYGIAGIISITIIMLLLYVPCSLSFLIICLAPFLLFSNNFFDSASLQVAIGIALAAERRAFLHRL